MELAQLPIAAPALPEPQCSSTCALSGVHPCLLNTGLNSGKWSRSREWKGFALALETEEGAAMGQQLSLLMVAHGRPCED